MAFLVYRADKRTDGVVRYSRVGNVVLAGNRNGLIYLACKGFLGTQDVGWTISAKDLLTAGNYDSESHALVIDIAPARSEVNLHELKSVSGYSYTNWTPL